MARIVIHEDVDVHAVTVGRTTTPRAFVVAGQAYTVDEVTHRWHGSLNGRHFQYWAVKVGTGTFTLYFNAEEVCWMTEEVRPPWHP